MKRTEAVLDIVYDGLHKKDFDAVYGVFGDEGLGKSNFLLHVLEYWINKKYNEVKPEDVKFIELDIVAWAKTLSELKKGDCCIWDEGGELSNKRSISNLNLSVSQAYQIIRGDNILSFIGMPSPFDLEGFFTKRRMRGMFYVYQRGRVAFWSRERLRKVIALNQYKRVKSVWVLKPTFFDTFPKYKGILHQAYLDKKKLFMKDTRKDLYETVKKIKGKDEKDQYSEEMLKLCNKGLTHRQIAEKFGLSRQAVTSRINKARQEAK